jgi:Xaa-Pro aminopeptidase
MNDPYLYPRFSLAERDRRWKAVREKMREQKLDVIVVPNNTGHSTDFQSSARYLSHCGGGGDADVAVVFPLEGEVTAIATSCNPRWQPEVQQWTKDVREARRRYGKVAVERMKELGLGEKARIGITGLGGGTRTPEGAIGHQFWLQIREGFPNAELIDATSILVETRYIKSDEEIGVLTKSMELVEKGYQAILDTARPGVKDWEVWAAAQYAMMKGGSEIPVHCNWISGKNVLRTLTRPSHRLLERGDLIINELEASWIGYRSQGVQPTFVGVADPVHIELMKMQKEVFNILIEMLRPGVTVGELVEKTEEGCAKFSPKSGPAAGAVAKLTLHGRGQGDDGPIITGHAREPHQLAVTLHENMVFIFKPSAEIHEPGRKAICTWGDTVVVGKSGGRRLGKRPHDLAVAGA